MPFTVSINVEREFETAATPAKVFGLLSDVPKSASFFPDVERLDNLGNTAYQWTMEKIGIGSYTLQQTLYACRYTSDAANLSVLWTPVEGKEYNALVDGAWAIKGKDDCSVITLKTRGKLTVDLPGFLQLLLSPLIELAFTQKIDHYITNIKEALQHSP
ncbi:MAG: SRPBCC family protein [Chlorobiaceae bacterium]